MTQQIFNSIEKTLAEFFKSQGKSLMKKWNASEQRTTLLDYVTALPVKKTALRRSSDENRPKRPLSAYVIYCTENRTAAKEANSTLNSKDITRELATQWRALSDKKKAPWNVKAATDKAEKLATNPPKEKVVKVSTRAKSAWQFFVAAKKSFVKEENSAFTNKEVMTELGQMWANTKTDNASPLARFQKMSNDSRPEKVPVEKKVSTRSLSAYQIFCGEQRATVQRENEEMVSKEVMTELGRLWNILKLDVEKLEVYQEKAVAAKNAAVKIAAKKVKADEAKASEKEKSPVKAKTSGKAKAPEKAKAPVKTTSEKKTVQKSSLKSTSAQ
jgi:hypothetical protein